MTFTLNANGMPLQTITVSPDPTGVWKGGFSNLPVKDDAKEPIVYSITEYVPAGYTCSHNEAQVTSRSATFINTKAPTPTVSDPNAPQQTYTITLPVDPIAYLDPEEPVIEPYVEPEPPAPEPEQAPVWTDPGTYATPLSSTAPAEEEDPEPAYLVQGDSLSPPTGDNAPLVPLVLTVAGLCGTVWALDKKKRSLR